MEIPYVHGIAPTAGTGVNASVPGLLQSIFVVAQYLFKIQGVQEASQSRS